MTAAAGNDEPIKIDNGVYWVGDSANALLNRNIYLRVFQGAGKTLNMVIDPGPPVDLEPMARKVSSVIGSLSKVQMVYVNHQDPDVGANTTYLAKLNPKLLTLMTEDTWRLVQFFGLDQKNFRAVERFKNLRISLPTGHRLQFIPTPFCHFRGACMVYDLETRILFSGDLFGGIASSDLTATEANWAGIKAFHQLYMPSNDALRLAVRRIRALDPAPLMIAPQHGGIIKGPLIEDFLERMNGLSVGLDIITGTGDRMPLIIDAVNEIISSSREVIGSDKVERVMQVFHPDGSYPAIFALSRDNRVTDIKADPVEAIEALTKLVFRHSTEKEKNQLQLRILKIFLDRNLPPLDVALSGEETAGVELTEG